MYSAVFDLIWRVNAQWYMIMQYKELKYNVLSKSAAFKPEETAHALSCKSKEHRIAEKAFLSWENLWSVTLNR